MQPYRFCCSTDRLVVKYFSCVKIKAPSGTQTIGAKNIVTCSSNNLHKYSLILPGSKGAWNHLQRPLGKMWVVSLIHSSLAVMIRFPVVLPQLLHKKIRSTFPHMPWLHFLCDCDLRALSNTFCTQCSPLSVKLYHQPHTAHPWMNIQVTYLLLFPSGWRLSDWGLTMQTGI